jgi:hypothetical protein
MPEASVDEYHLPKPRKYQVRFARQFGAVQAKPKSLPMHKTADLALRRRIPSPNRGHYLRALLHRIYVHCG